MIADDRAGVGRFGHPLGDQALGKFALRVFVVENRPLMAGVERALDALQFHLTQVGGFLAGDALVEPQSGAHFHGAALAVLVQQKKKVNGMHQVRSFAQQAFALAHRFPYQIEFTVLEVAQAAVNDASRPAGDARGEIVLLDQQSALAGAGALARHGDAVNAAADDHHLKVLAFQGGSRFDR